MYKGFLFSTSFSVFTMLRFFNNRHPVRYEMIYHCSFDVHFLDK